ARDDHDQDDATQNEQEPRGIDPGTPQHADGRAAGSRPIDHASNCEQRAERPEKRVNPPEPLHPSVQDRAQVVDEVQQPGISKFDFYFTSQASGRHLGRLTLEWSDETAATSRQVRHANKAATIDPPDVDLHMFVAQHVWLPFLEFGVSGRRKVVLAPPTL